MILINKPMDKTMQKLLIFLKAFLIFLSLLGFFSYSVQTKIPSSEQRHFSPNLDGIKDRLVIGLNIRDNGNLEKWIVDIIEKTDERKFSVIRTYESQSAREIHHMTPKKFFSRMFEKKQPIIIPSFIEWDGRSVLKTGDTVLSTPMKDGVYYFRISAIDESGNIGKTPLVPVVLDTVRPETSVTAGFPIFSPNNDGNKETNRLSITSKNLEPLDTVILKINRQNDEKNGMQLLIKGSEFNNNKFHFIWNGKDTKGKDLPEGTYTIVTEASDLAGNKSGSGSITVKMVRTYETAVLAASIQSFSPNGDGFYDTVSFDINVSSQVDLNRWTIDIKDAAKNSIRTYSGENQVPALITFEGLDNNKKILPDGIYLAQLSLDFHSGNVPKSPEISLTIDTTPPAVSVAMDHFDFIPIEGTDGRKEITICQTASGNPGDSFTGIITDVMGNTVFTTDFKEAVPEELKWNGKNSAGDVIAGTYTYTLHGSDLVGNRAAAVTKPFELLLEKAEITVSADLIAFSPNDDGNKDSVEFAFTANATERITVQELSITGEDRKKTVRSFRSESFQDTIKWNGKDDSGAVLPDGKYFYTLSVKYTSGENPVVAGKFVFLDTTPIAISLEAEYPVFSPNGDGNKDVMIISQKKTPSAINDHMDSITLTIKDKKDVIHRRNTWTGSIPSTVRWGGTDQSKADAPEGIYIYELSAEDIAGNRSSFRTENFVLVRTMEKVTITISDYIFSAQSLEDSRHRIEMIPAFSSKKFLTGYSLSLRNEGGENFQLHENLYTNDIFVWNGADSTGEKIPDGEWKLFLNADYESGNRPESDGIKLIVDNTPPHISIFTSPEYFSPDKDGIDDELNIGLKISDQFTINDVELVIYRYAEFDNNNQPFTQTLENYQNTKQIDLKKWNFNSTLDTILKWDGTCIDGSKVESANDYILFARAVDEAGNISVSSQIIKVDVLVEHIDEDNKRIIINSINFRFNSDKMIGNYEKTLDRLVFILEKFPAYKIKIIGHTDSRGSESHNLELSKKRARTVYTYLVSKDVQRERLSTDGKGKNELLIDPEKNEDPAITEENYRKNRRVEFFLIKSSGK